MRPSLLALLFTAGAASLVCAAEYPGLVLPLKEVVVSAPVQARIEHINVKEGDRVKAGDTLAQLYSRIEELDTLRTKAALEKREFDYKGSKNLSADSIISQDEALKAKIELDLARLQHEQAAEVLAQRTIKAPLDGIVVEKHQEAGETVASSQPLFRLVDISRLYVQFYIRAEDAGAIRLGDTLEVRCPVADATRVFPGKVDFVDPRVDAASGLMRVKVLLDNNDALLKPGLRANVSIPGR
jgi:membrane fusion protein (multidrug efflux system)